MDERLVIINNKLAAGEALTNEETTALQKLIALSLEPLDMTPARIELRCKAWEKKEIEQRARQAGKTVTEYILDRALTDDEVDYAET